MNPEQGPDLDERDLEEIAALLDGRLEGEDRQRALERLGQNEQAYQVYVESARFLDWQAEQGEALPAGGEGPSGGGAPFDSGAAFDSGAPPDPRSPGRWRWLPAAAVAALVLMGFGTWQATTPQSPAEFVASLGLSGADQKLGANIFGQVSGAKFIDRSSWPDLLQPFLEPVARWRTVSTGELKDAAIAGAEVGYLSAGVDLDPTATALRAQQLIELAVVGRQRERLRALLEKDLSGTLERLDRIDLASYLYAAGSPQLALQQLESAQPLGREAGFVVTNNIALIRLVEAHDALARCSSRLAAELLAPLAWDLRRPYRTTRSGSEEWQECEPAFEDKLDRTLLLLEGLIGRDPTDDVAHVNYMAALLIGHLGNDLEIHLGQIPEALRSSAIGKVFAALAPVARRYEVCSEAEGGPQVCEAALRQLDEIETDQAAADSLAFALTYNRAMLLLRLDRKDEANAELRRFLAFAPNGFYAGRASAVLGLDQPSRQSSSAPDHRQAVVAALDAIDLEDLEITREQQVEIGTRPWRLLRLASSLEDSLIVASESEAKLAVRRVEWPIGAQPSSRQETVLGSDSARMANMKTATELELAGLRRLPTLFRGNTAVEVEVWVGDHQAYRVERRADGSRVAKAQILVRPGFLDKAEIELFEETASQEQSAASVTEETASWFSLLASLVAVDS